MKTIIRTCALLGAIGILAFLALHYAPGARRARLLRRADRDYAAGRIDAAEIEYLGVLRAGGPNVRAIDRLAIVYFDQGRQGTALAFLVEARRLDPANLDVRLRMGLYLLGLGNFRDARDEALFILARRPADGQAALLLAESAVAPDDIAAARVRIGSLPPPAAGAAPTLIALGTLDFRQRRFPQADALFNRALSIDPASSDAHTALAALRWIQNDSPGAGREFALAMERAPSRPAKALQLAQFKLQSGDRAAGRRILQEMAASHAGFLPSAVLLAELDESEKRPAESEALVAGVLERDPGYPDALLLWARLRIAAGKPAEAIAALTGSRGIRPGNPLIAYELAQAYLAIGAPDKAAGSLATALLWNPRFIDAAVLLAQIRIDAGDPAAAVVLLKQVVKARPDLAQPRFLLAHAYIVLGNLDDALAIYRQLAAEAPADPRARLFTGMILLRQNHREDAGRYLDQALALDRDSSLALEQRVDLDLVNGNPSAAATRVAAQLVRKPSQPGLNLLLGKVLLAEGDRTGAEKAWRKAIKLQPGESLPYLLLAELYADTRQDKKALADLHEMIARIPDQKQALMLMAVAQERENDPAAAQASYERVIAIDPGFVPALNNLACLYADRPDRLEDALGLARRARALMPQEPRVADTLGWVLYRNRQYVWAQSLLKESSDALPSDPLIAFHLGMNLAMLGQDAAARLALDRALRIDPAFAGNPAARERLAVLSIDGETAGPSARAILEKAAAKDPHDPAAASRLAALYERDGAPDKAIAVSEALLAQDPSNEPALARLARLYASKGDTDHALALAKSARALDPADTTAARVLASLAYRSGDYPWAVSLLSEAAGRRPGDPEILFDLAKAWFAVGRVPEAAEAIRTVLALPGPFSRAAEATRLLDLIGLEDHRSAGEDARVAVALRAEPGNVAALMARGAIALRAGDPAAARAAFASALAADPHFSPAARNLVVLDAANPGDDGTALGLAAAARETYPDDPGLAKAYGILLYRQGNYTRAAGLLQESASRRADDADLMFYLGMAQYRLRDKSSRGTLQRALSLDPRSGLAAEARSALADR